MSTEQRDEQSITYDDRRAILSSLLNTNLQQYHADSYNTLVERHIASIVATYGSLTTICNERRHLLKIVDVCVHPDEVTPNEAHDFGLNLSMAITGTLVLESDEFEPISARTIIARLPAMTGLTTLSSALDDIDPVRYPIGGAHVVHGKLRTVPPTKSQRFDAPLLLRRKNTYYLQVRSRHPAKIYRSTSTVDIVIAARAKRPTAVGMIGVRLPFQQRVLVHIAVVVKALGCPPDEFNHLVASFAGDAYDPMIFRRYEISMVCNKWTDRIKTIDSATMVISKIYGKNLLSTGRGIIKNELLPHVGYHATNTDPMANAPTPTLATVRTNRSGTVVPTLTVDECRAKVLYLADMCRMLILFRHGRIPGTDRDSVAVSSITSSANHLGTLFRLLFIAHMRTAGKLLRRALMKHSKKKKQKSTTTSTKKGSVTGKRKRGKTAAEPVSDPVTEPSGPAPRPNIEVDLVRIYGETRLSARLMSSVSSGIWSARRKGLSISLNNNNDDAIMLQQRRLSSSLATTDGSHTKPRAVPIDSWGFICSAYTPDGDSTGLIYELALTATTTPEPNLVSRRFLVPLLVDHVNRVKPGTIIPLRDIYFPEEGADWSLDQETDDSEFDDEGDLDDEGDDDEGDLEFDDGDAEDEGDLDNKDVDADEDKDEDEEDVAGDDTRRRIAAGVAAMSVEEDASDASDASDADVEDEDEDDDEGDPTTQSRVTSSPVTGGSPHSVHSPPIPMSSPPPKTAEPSPVPVETKTPGSSKPAGKKTKAVPVLPVHPRTSYRTSETDVFLYGPEGCCDYLVKDVDLVIAEFRKLRRAGCISRYAFIERDDKSQRLEIRNEEGILARPLIIVEELHRIPAIIQAVQPHALFRELLSQGIIEYVSAAEVTTICKIAICRDDVSLPGVTHVELSEAAMLGTQASTVAFVTSQQGPRAAYFTGQRKQIITSKPAPRRGNIVTTTLWNSHRSLVRSDVADILGCDTCRATPMVVAILPLEYDQEDALIIKQSTLDFGALTCTTTRTYVSEATLPNSVYSELFEKSKRVLSRKTADYHAISENGLPHVGTHVKGGDIIISKTRSVRKTHGAEGNGQTMTIGRRDISTVTRKDESGVVTQSMISTLPTGTRATVEVSTTRLHQVGDKMTTSFSGKGVDGQIVPHADMPFSMRTGCPPDIVISPLSKVSRMIMGSLLECITGKTVAVTGDMSIGLDRQEFSVSNKKRAQEMGDLLGKHGFNRTGTEMYIDGRSGEMIEGEVFTGIIDIYRLVHIASRKVHARSTGPRDPLTRQPRDGRRFGGGLRLGSMEVSHVSLIFLARS